MFWEQLLRDVRYAGRMMAANPLFSAMAALSLALGIGANTAIYSFMDAILARALPVQHPESLILFNWHSKDFPGVAHSSSGSSWRDPHTGYTTGNMPYPFYDQVREDRSVLASVFGFSLGERMNLQIRGQADVGQGQYVTGGFFSGLGVPPAAGRLIDSTDDRVGAPLVAAFGYSYALRRFGDAARAVGQSVLINNTPFTVVGVVPADFFGVNPDGQQDLYLPLHAGIALDTGFGDSSRKYADGNYYWLQMMAGCAPESRTSRRSRCWRRCSAGLWKASPKPKRNGRTCRRCC